MPKARCRHRLPSPAVAGAGDIVDRETGEVLRLAVDVLRDWAAQWPHLRPCPRHKGSKGTWDWTYRNYCENCPEAIRRNTE